VARFVCAFHEGHLFRTFFENINDVMREMAHVGLITPEAMTKE
jgi:hypothetical protein